MFDHSGCGKIFTSIAYPDLVKWGVVAEDVLTQIGSGAMLCNSRSLVGTQASIIELRKPPMCVGGAVLMANCIALLIPMSWDEEFLIDGQQMDLNSVYMVDSPNGFFSRGMKRHYFGLTVDRELFRETLAALLGIEPDDLSTLSAHCNVPLPVKRYISFKCERLLQHAYITGDAAPSESISDDHLTQRVQEIILEICLFLECRRERSNSAYINSSRIVRRAEEWFADAEVNQLSLADLCKATGASSSALYGAFSDMLGMPPLRYFRMRRLNGAHDALCRSMPERGLVSKVATAFGFTELGRFSMEYRQLFGVSPSATISSGSTRERRTR